MKGFLRQCLGRIMGRRPAALQVAALCLDPASGRVLLITSRGTKRWIIPKGWPMAGHSLAEAAQQEAWEEAGVTGPAHPKEIGSYHYDKLQDRGFGIPVDVRVFAIDVKRLHDKFPEAGQRIRQWFPPAEAAGLVAEPGLQTLLRTLPAPVCDKTRPSADKHRHAAR